MGGVDNLITQAIGVALAPITGGASLVAATPKASRKITANVKEATKWGADRVNPPRKVEDKLKASGVNVGGSTSTKFGEGADNSKRQDPPGYFDAPAQPAPPVRDPNPINIGRGGPEIMPPPTQAPWENAVQGQAPENPPAWEAFVPPNAAQVRRLKYRKYAKDRGL